MNFKFTIILIWTSLILCDIRMLESIQIIDKKSFLTRVFAQFVTWSTGTYFASMFLRLGMKIYGHCAQYPAEIFFLIFLWFPTFLTMSR